MRFPWEGEWKFLIKDEEEDLGFGKYPYQRSIEELLQAGVVNLDKPRGPTSHQVCAWVREILGNKTGHGGTLDPPVSGVLPIAVGRATKLISALLKAGKEYVCVMELHAGADPEKVISTLKMFEGSIIQKPPAKSAVKKRLRVRKIYWIIPLEIEDNLVLFRVGTEAGTYIRKLCHDVGVILGVGAHMAELRRIRVGPFDESTLCTLQDLKDAIEFWKEGDEEPLRRCLHPPEKIVEHLPKIIIRDSAVDSICHGADLKVPGILRIQENIKKGDLVAIMTKKGELVALGKALMDAKTMFESEKGIAVDVERVFMPRGTYPPLWRKKGL